MTRQRSILRVIPNKNFFFCGFLARNERKKSRKDIEECRAKKEALTNNATKSINRKSVRSPKVIT